MGWARTGGRRRRWAAFEVGAALGLATLLTWGAASARADIGGAVTTAAGGPLRSATVRITDANGVTFATRFTDALGAYVVTSATIGTRPGPYSVAATHNDACRPFAERARSATQGGVVDGATASFALDVREMCPPSSVSSSLPAATGLVIAETAEVVTPLSGLAYATVPLPSGATGVALALDDGTPAGGGVSGSSSLVQIQAPPRAYAGGLTIAYTSAGVPVRYRLGTLSTQARARPVASTGALDLVNIVNISGSSASSDPAFVRRDAVSLVLDLAPAGDRVGAVGFDSVVQDIFPLTTIDSLATVRRLKALARAGIINRGGTNYDVAFQGAYAQLAGSPDSARPKAAIFLTDGGHSGTYGNSHLRLVANGTGRPWPVCVVQLGTSFASADVARLRRIASETGGLYVRAPSSARLTDVYFRCRGRSAGETTRGTRRTTLRPGGSTVFRQRVPRRQGDVTFFVAWEGSGRVEVSVRQPGGRVYTASRRPRAVVYRAGSRYAFFRIPRPRAGVWRITARARGTVGAVTLRTTTRPLTPAGPVVRLGGTPLTPPPGQAALTCGEDEAATIVGSDGDDVIIGTPAKDVIVTGPGNDLVRGLGGNDLICLGAGADRGEGGPGADRIWGHSTDLSPAPQDQNAGRFLPDEGNVILGQAGNDQLHGAAGPDVISGGDGRDFANGGPGDDVLRGGAGNDELTSEDGADVVSGDAGVDRVGGGDGDDRIAGGGGNDQLIGGPGGDRLSGGPGRDDIFGGLGADAIAGGPGDDRLVGDLFSNPPDGHGPDVIFGGDGNDRIIGGGGGDILNGGLGVNEITGDGGDDVIRTGDVVGDDERDPRARARIERAVGGEGNDTLSGGNGNDVLSGQNGNDAIDGAEGPDRITGGEGDDLLQGGPGPDVVDGGGGDDRLLGGPGADQLLGGAGSDLMFGGADDDRLLGESSLAGAGNDRLLGGPGDDIIISGFLSDVFLGGPGDDALSTRLAPPGFADPGRHRMDGGPGRDRCGIPAAKILSIARCELR